MLPRPAKIADELIKEGRSGDIWSFLFGSVHISVARDLANEPARREAMARRREIKAARKSSHRSSPHDFDRNILKTVEVGGREWRLHATKGWRPRRA